MNTLMTASIAFVICSVAFANAISEPDRIKLLQRIQEGNPAAMLEAGQGGDVTMIPALEEFLQARSNAVEETMSRLAKAYGNEEERRRFMLPREAIMTSEYDIAAQNARTALARLHVKKYLDEILTELIDPTNSTVFRVWGGNGFSVQAGALKKLAYVKDPSTVKFAAKFLNETERQQSDAPRPPLAWYAICTLRSLVDNPPATNDFKVWQEWWGQNRDRYP
jgi:hypothetical protein